MATVGRPKDSCVWNFFEYLEEDKSVCLVTLSDGEHVQCGHSIQERFPTKLKCHLKIKQQSFRKKRVTR